MPCTAAATGLSPPIGMTPMTIAERDHAGGLGGLAVMVAH